MEVIGFFSGFFDSFGQVFVFITTPLGELNNAFKSTPLGDLSIFQALGVGLATTLVVFLVIHVIRLFVGG